MNNYLVVFDNTYNQEDITKLFDASEDILFWFYSMSNSIFIQSSLSQKEVFHLIENHFKTNQRLFVTKLTSGDYYGRIPREHWEFLGEKAKR